MSREAQRWAAAGLGFAAAVMWTTVGAGAALTCLLAAGLCAGAVVAREGGLVGRVGGVVSRSKRWVAAAVPAPASRPERRRKPQPAARPTPAPTATERTPEPQPAPVVRPYDHDVPSGEHVYEVANYGW